MRYIDADKLTEAFVKAAKQVGNIGDQIAFRMMINEIPAADVVEVTRCKYCIYKEECGREVLVNEYDNDKAVDITGFLFYCSYGERAEE